MIATVAATATQVLTVAWPAAVMASVHATTNTVQMIHSHNAITGLPAGQCHLRPPGEQEPNPITTEITGEL